MKILVVTGRFGENYSGGIERVSYEVVKRLAEDHDILVLAHKRTSDASAGEEQFPVRTVSSLNIPKTNFWVFFYLFLKRRLVRESIKYFQPDVIYAHNPYDTYVSLGFGVPVISHIHSLYTDYFRSQESSRTYLPKAYWNWFWKYRISIEKEALSKSSLVITYSTFLADLAKDRGARKVAIIPNGVDTKIFSQTGQRSTELQKPAVVYVGRIEKVKGIQYLVEAAKKMPDVKFYLIGDMKDEYAFPNNIFLLGSKNSNAVADYLRSADIFLNPVTRDGFEIANMEALACGVPVITTDAFERSELYKHSAYLVRPEDSEQIVVAIREILSNESLRTKLIEEGKLLALQHDWSAITSSIENLLAEHASLSKVLERNSR